MNFLARIIVTFSFFLAGFSLAAAEERIKSFVSNIDVQLDGDFIVTETITVNAEGRQIRRGIFRDLPRYQNYQGHEIPVRYDILSVTRNGKKEPYAIEKDGNAYRIRIGDADRFLPHEDHSYSVKFEIKDEIRRDTDFDEVYWNVTGNYWRFPIDRASVSVHMPDGAQLLNHDAFTGVLGKAGKDFSFTQSGGIDEFVSTRTLFSGEGMTISLKYAKGVMLPEPESTRRYIWWLRNGALILLSLSLLGIVGYYYRSWNKVGRDPAKDPVFARYEPPDGYSAAAASYIYYRGVRGHKALTATLIGLATKNWLKIETEKTKTVMTPLDRDIKSGTTIGTNFTLTREAFAAVLKGDMEALKSLGVSMENDGDEDVDMEQFKHTSRIMPDKQEAYLFAKLFPASRLSSLTLKKKVNTHFNSGYESFKRHLLKQFGKPYHRLNLGYIMFGIIASLLAIGITLSQTSRLTPSWIWVLIAGLVVLNLLFIFLMPAPTKKGQKIRTEIEGFRLYLKTAEKQKFDAVEVGSDAPPPMSVDRYEDLLPYAVALGVEEPWSRFFEKVMPEEAKNYDPHWNNSGRFRSVSHMTDNMVSNISSGVSSAAPQSSGSSSSGGGGFSGGGGGGGGGGGW